MAASVNPQMAKQFMVQRDLIKILLVAIKEVSLFVRLCSPHRKIYHCFRLIDYKPSVMMIHHAL